jgi:hypothetical protein
MKKLFLCLIFMAALPLLVSQSPTNTVAPSPYATVAFAGHNSMGGWCQCGTDGCICDPGEQPGNNLSTTSPSDKSVDQDAEQSVDPASGLMVLTLALLFWLRLRI